MECGTVECGTVAVGTTVLEAARALGVDLDSVCGGRALCGRCQITVAEGSSGTATMGMQGRSASGTDWQSDNIELSYP